MLTEGQPDKLPLHGDGSLPPLQLGQARHVVGFEQSDGALRVTIAGSKGFGKSCLCLLVAHRQEA